jgi:hypothetical protein
MPSHACAVWALIKRILRYIRGTIGHGIHIYGSIGAQITVHSDADWAGCLDTQCSTSGYCVFIGDSLVAWSSKQQTTVSRFSTEAEYRTIANATSECCWLRQLLLEFHIIVDKASIMYIIVGPNMWRSLFVRRWLWENCALFMCQQVCSLQTSLQKDYQGKSLKIFGLV